MFSYLDYMILLIDYMVLKFIIQWITANNIFLEKVIFCISPEVFFMRHAPRMLVLMGLLAVPYTLHLVLRLNLLSSKYVLTLIKRYV